VQLASVYNRVVQKLQFLNNDRLKWQNAEHFAGLVSQLEVGREPTGFLNKSNVGALWTDWLNKDIRVPFWYKTGANTRSVREATGFVGRH
jgi:hypothetical protein